MGDNGDHKMVIVKILSILALCAAIGAILYGVPRLYSWSIKRRARTWAWQDLEERVHELTGVIKISGAVAAFTPAMFCLALSLWHLTALPTWPSVQGVLFVAFAVLGYLGTRRMLRYRLIIESNEIALHTSAGVDRFDLRNLVAVECKSGFIVLLSQTGEYCAIPAVFEATDRIFAGLIARVVENADAIR
jgi:hypothetical protein